MLTTPLYPYQDSAVDQALDRGTLLIAYGMGLGKTIVQLAVCEELLGDDQVEVNAIVVPASLKWQWAQAIAKFTDVQTEEVKVKGVTITVPIMRHCTMINGTLAKRLEQYEYARQNRPPYVLLGYENVVDDWRYVRRIRPDLVAGDEIAYIKSFGAQRSLNFKKWRTKYRYGLTGTPMYNRPDELYSIMEWVSDPDEDGNPEDLGRFDHFDRAYVTRVARTGKVIRYKNLDLLHQKTKGFMARKTRFDPDVAPYMPRDFHREYYATLAPKVRTLYKEVADELADDLEEISGGWFDLEAFHRGEKAGGSEEQGRAAAKMSALSMLCCHPRLLVESAKRFERTVFGDGGKFAGSKYAYELWKDGRLDGLDSSPKLDDVVQKVADVLEEDGRSKVIVFSFYKDMLRILHDEIRFDSVLYHGSPMSGDEREAAKVRFKTDPEVRVFLSSDAGGTGVDLPEANYLANYDPVWSFGQKDQRDMRHVRAGSHWDEVFILNYMVEGSVEEWKYEVQSLKRRVAGAIMDGEETVDGTVDNDVDSLRRWLASHRV